METLTIISIAAFALLLVGGIAGYIWQSRKSAKAKAEPQESRSCVLCNHTGTTWSKLAPYECCERIAVVCTICEREAGEALASRVKEWHEQLFCPESIAAAPIFGKMDALVKRSQEEMLKRPDALHQANLNAAQLHRKENEVKAELKDKLDWANTLIDSFANEEERKALWIALGARYSKVQFGEAMAQVIQRAA